MKLATSIGTMMADPNTLHVGVDGINTGNSNALLGIVGDCSTAQDNATTATGIQLLQSEDLTTFVNMFGSTSPRTTQQNDPTDIIQNIQQQQQQHHQPSTAAWLFQHQPPPFLLPPIQQTQQNHLQPIYDAHGMQYMQQQQQQQQQMQTHESQLLQQQHYQIPNNAYRGEPMAQSQTTQPQVQHQTLQDLQQQQQQQQQQQILQQQQMTLAFQAVMACHQQQPQPVQVEHQEQLQFPAIGMMSPWLSNPLAAQQVYTAFMQQLTHAVPPVATLANTAANQVPMQSTATPAEPSATATTATNAAVVHEVSPLTGFLNTSGNVFHQSIPSELIPQLIPVAQAAQTEVLNTSIETIQTPPSQQIPTFVNAKQYRRIIKRREARAKMDEYYCRQRIRTGGNANPNSTEGMVTVDENGMPTKKAYMHESRHRHAMKRPRGKGGRFLRKEELPAYYAEHPEDDPDNPINQVHNSGTGSEDEDHVNRDDTKKRRK